jgi:hypothetical protein
MIASLSKLYSTASRVASHLIHPYLDSAAKTKGNRESVFALANRVSLVGAPSWRQLPPRKQAEIKVELAAFLLDKAGSFLPDKGGLRVSYFGLYKRGPGPNAAFEFDLKALRVSFEQPHPLPKEAGVEGK